MGASVARRLAAGAAVTVLALGGAGCTRDHGSRKAFCEQVRRVPRLSDVLAGYQRADPTEFDRRLAAARSAYSSLRSSAPSDLRGDATAMVDLVDAIFDAVAAHRDDPTAATTAVREAARAHPDAAPAAEKVVTYAREQCSVTLEPAPVP